MARYQAPERRLEQDLHRAGGELHGWRGESLPVHPDPVLDTQPEESWATGSRQANCALIATEGEGFATLKGDARQQFTVNGKPPKTPPKRLPKRGDSPAPAPEGENSEGNPTP